MSFEGSTLWRIRQQVGHDLVLWPGATVLVEDRHGRVLLGRRRDNGEWTMPGGGAEANGSFATTALTELHEEVGIEAERADLIAFASVSEPEDHVVRYPEGDVTHYFGIWFVLRRWQGDAAPDGEELVEIGWFGRDGLPEPLMHSTAVAFRHYARYLDSGVFQVG